jgi:hypothetical protein
LCGDAFGERIIEWDIPRDGQNHIGSVILSASEELELVNC